MAKGPLIEPIKPLIASVYRDHPKWKPHEIRMSVRSILREESKEHPELLLKLNKGWPSESSIRDIIKDISSKPKLNPKDDHWSLVALSKKDCDIPPEALSKVMFIYEKRLRASERFTIREALWIARLHEIIDDLDVLDCFASAYALREWLDWVLDNPKSYTRDIDLTLIRYMDGRITAADIAEHPYLIHPLPTLGGEEEEELEMKLRGKGYSLGISLTEEEAQRKSEKRIEDLRKEGKLKTLPRRGNTKEKVQNEGKHTTEKQT